MKKSILSLAHLKAAHAALFGTADPKEGKNTEEASDDKDTGEKSEGSADDDSEKEDEKKETSAATTSADTQPKGVFLSHEDYQVVTELASEAVQLREENKGLKAKADLWESYQAALHGVKPGADSAGAKGEEAKAESQDSHAGLREKYPTLMKDI